MNRQVLILLMVCWALVLTGCRHDVSAGIGGKVTVIASTGRFGSARWSPDGTRLTVLHTDENGTPAVEVRSETGQLMQTLASSIQLVSPGWVGDTPAYLLREVKGSNVELVVHAANGDQTIANIPGASLGSWSRDGDTVVLTRTMDGSLSLWVLAINTRQLREIWGGEPPQRVAVSPSGRYVAFTNLRSSAVSVMEIESGTVKELWRVPSPGTALPGLTWSPDDKYVGVRRIGDDAGFYLLDREGRSAPVLLTNEDMVDPDWSPTGDRIVYSTVGHPGENELRILHLPTNWGEGLQSSE